MITAVIPSMKPRWQWFLQQQLWLCKASVQQRCSLSSCPSGTTLQRSSDQMLRCLFWMVDVCKTRMSSMDWLQLAAKCQNSSLLVVFGFSLHACQLQDSTDRMETSICIQNLNMKQLHVCSSFFPAKKKPPCFAWLHLPCFQLHGVVNLGIEAKLPLPRSGWHDSGSWSRVNAPRHVDLGLLAIPGVGELGADGGENWMFFLVGCIDRESSHE